MSMTRTSDASIGVETGFEQVLRAADRLRGIAHRTPTLTSRQFDSILGAQTFFKCENFQRGGSFKFRGAFNAIASIPKTDREKGVVAFSSGNHAQAIALAARELGIPATVIMPEDTPAAKLEGTRTYGANVIQYNRFTDDREAIARTYVSEGGMTLVPPFNHWDVLSGQGTATLELIDEVGALDYIFCCVGGGGLISGTALAANKLIPNCVVIGVEPEAGNDGQQSLRENRIVSIDPPKTIADGARTQALGTITFPIIRALVKNIVTVTDRELISSMRFFAERMKIVLEPTGCLAAAGALKHREMLQNKRVGVILSGGNVDMTLFSSCIAA